MHTKLSLKLRLFTLQWILLLRSYYLLFTYCHSLISITLLFNSQILLKATSWIASHKCLQRLLLERNWQPLFGWGLACLSSPKASGSMMLWGVTRRWWCSGTWGEKWPEWKSLRCELTWLWGWADECGSSLKDCTSGLEGCRYDW